MSTRSTSARRPSCPDLPRRVLGALPAFAAVGDREVGARPGAADGDRAADPARRPGDQHDLAVQPHAASPP